MIKLKARINQYFTSSGEADPRLVEIDIETFHGTGHFQQTRTFSSKADADNAIFLIAHTLRAMKYQSIEEKDPPGTVHLFEKEY